MLLLQGDFADEGDVQILEVATATYLAVGDDADEDDDELLIEEDIFSDEEEYEEYQEKLKKAYKLYRERVLETRRDEDEE